MQFEYDLKLILAGGGLNRTSLTHALKNAISIPSN